MTDVIGLGREIIPSNSRDILEASYSDNSCSTLVDFSRFTTGKKKLVQAKYIMERIVCCNLNSTPDLNAKG